MKHGMFCEVLYLVCHIRPGTDIRQQNPVYNEHTCLLLEYLSWEARGRKDADCKVEKPWENRDPAALRRMAPLELSCLPLNRLSGQVSCQETERLYRLAHLFQVAFFQYILSNTGRYRAFHTVEAADGIVKATFSDPTAIEQNSKSRYPGIPAEMDLSLPEVKAALHALWCCAIKTSARALLEYFFRGE
jgi:hypothetical protein